MNVISNVMLKAWQVVRLVSRLLSKPVLAGTLEAPVGSAVRRSPASIINRRSTIRTEALPMVPKGTLIPINRRDQSGGRGAVVFR